MRCYRCGAWMNEDTDTCPACGFFLHSPVEIRMHEEMTNIRIYDDAKNELWSGEGTGTVYIDTPEHRNIRVCWGPENEMWMRVKNGEAYRFELRISKTARRLGDVRPVKTRTIPKRHRNSKRAEGGQDGSPE